MAEILLIRHGQSANNAQAEHLRVSDPGLTEIGAQQAAALAAWLQHHPVDYLYCSPFLRSLETVRPLAESLQLPVRIRSDLFELGGCYSGHEAGKQRGEPGMGRSQLSAGYPNWHVDEAIGEHGWWGRDYESWEQGVARARSVERWLATELSQLDGTHALVIHADFKRLLIEAMLSEKQLTRLGIDLAEVGLFNTGISVFEYDGSQWEARQFNSMQHLPVNLWT